MLVHLLPQVKGLPGGLIVTIRDGKNMSPLDELTVAGDHLTYRQENGITLAIVPFEQIAWIEVANLTSLSERNPHDRGSVVGFSSRERDAG
jgi:hypothetical protein